MRNTTIAAIAILFATSSFAEYKYEYTGTGVGSNAVSIFLPTDKVESFFVLSHSLVSGNYGATHFLDYGTKIGSLVLGKTTGADIGAHFETGRNGQVISWSFVIGKYSSPSADPALVEVWSNSSDLAPAGDRITIYDQGSRILGATSSPGIWKEVQAPIPEPSTILYMALGFVFLLRLIGRVR